MPELASPGLLAELAEGIRCEVELFQSDAQSAVAHAVRAGELLIEAKGRVEHGGWLPWLEANFEFTQQTANSYMRIASNYGTSRDLPLSVNAALKELTRSVGDPPDEDASALVVVQPDRCDRCDRIIRTDRPHDCPEALRRLNDAYGALYRAYRDVGSYPRSSEADSGRHANRAEECARLAGRIVQRLNGEPEPDEREERAQRTIEGVGFPVCDCGSRLAEHEGRPYYCYRCASYREAT